jgi:hypothetical protein
MLFIYGREGTVYRSDRHGLTDKKIHICDWSDGDYRKCGTSCQTNASYQSLTLLKVLEMNNYDTVTEAVEGLKERGYTVDFNLHENCLVCHDGKFNPADFEIAEVYRFEGDSDPSDEAVVYAIESITGMKGVLVNGYGVSADPLSSDMAKKLRIQHS